MKASHNKSLVRQLKSMRILNIRARGDGTKTYPGNFRIETETEIINLSWERNGQPHIAIHSKDNYTPSYFGDIHDMVDIVDEQGQVHTEWPNHSHEEEPPVRPIVNQAPKPEKPNKGCPAHPQYSAQRRPRNGCDRCMELYNKAKGLTDGTKKKAS